MSIYRNLPDAEYRAMYLDHLSVSNWRNWMRCPAAQHAKEQGKWQEPERDPQKDPLLIGTFAHCALLEPDKLKAWCEEHPEIILQSGKNKGKPGEEYQKAMAIVTRILSDPMAENVLAGEHEFTLDGEIAGVPWCGRLDVVNIEHRLFFDFKTTASFADKWDVVDGKNVKVPWYSAYWPQIAVYAELLEQNFPSVDGAEPWTGIIIGGTKQNPPAIGLWSMDSIEKLASALSGVMETQDQVMAWRRGEGEPEPCGDTDSCPYCREHSTLKLRKAV